MLCIQSSNEHTIDLHVILFYPHGQVPCLQAIADGLPAKNEFLKRHLQACIETMTTPTNEPVAYVFDGNASLYVISPVPEKQVCMIRKYHNHTLQTNPRHHEEEPQSTNSHMISGRQLK